MKKIYIIILFFISFFSITLIYDLSIYFYNYDVLINIQESVCYIVKNSGGITFELKEYLSSKEVLIEYEKSDDINGATFEFSLLRKLDYLLIMNDKYVKIDLVVILGY